MVCFYTPVSVVNMAYIKDNSITFFQRPTLLEREPVILLKESALFSKALLHHSGLTRIISLFFKKRQDKFSSLNILV